MSSTSDNCVCPPGSDAHLAPVSSLIDKFENLSDENKVVTDDHSSTVISSRSGDNHGSSAGKEPFSAVGLPNNLADLHFSESKPQSVPKTEASEPPFPLTQTQPPNNLKDLHFTSTSTSEVAPKPASTPDSAFSSVKPPNNLVDLKFTSNNPSNDTTRSSGSRVEKEPYPVRLEETVTTITTATLRPSQSQGETEPLHCDSALEAFKVFTEASDLEDTLASFEELRRVSGCPPSSCTGGMHGREVYHAIKNAVTNDGSRNVGAELWRALDQKMAREEYFQHSSSEPSGSAHPGPHPHEGPLPCRDLQVLIVGAGPAGLRTAIEAELLGARTLVLEKRTSFSRNNALHLWPFSIQDLKSLGAKFFWGRFCTGLINHVAVKRLQLILLKCALVCGVHVVPNSEFLDLLEPSSSNHRWSATVRESGGEEKPLGFEFDVLLGADGEKSHVADLAGFERKCFQGGTAIGITANFVNSSKREETALDEFGLLSVYNREFFDGLEEKTGVRLENLVMYHDETHYFVMTPKKESLISKGVLISGDTSDTGELLSRDNVNREKLKLLAREVADYCNLPSYCEFAKKNTSGGSGGGGSSIGAGDDDDVEIFDFSKKQQSIEPCKLHTGRDHRAEPLLIILVGDSLIEPFWPQGTGANRALLSALDAAWTIKALAESRSEHHQHQQAKQPQQEQEDEGALLLERGAYKLLQTTSPEDLKLGADTGLDPATRYKGFSSVKTSIAMR